MLHNYSFLFLSFLFSAGILAGFVDAIAGGGGLISIPALFYAGLPITNVFATNKLQSSVGTLVATIKYYKSGLINLKTVWRGFFFGSLGAVLGTITLKCASNHFMRYVIPFLMLLVFIFNLIYKDLGVVSGKKRLNEVVFFSLFGFILGFYDAFFGPGTGNFWIIAIVYFLGYTFLEASGYAKILNLKSNLISLALFFYYGKVHVAIGLIMAAGQIIGGYLGATMVVLRGARLVKPIFMAVIGLNILMFFYHDFF